MRKNKGGGRKRTANEAELDDEPANQGARQELVRLEDIEMVYSKRRKDKEAKMEAILKGKFFLKTFCEHLFEYISTQFSPPPSKVKLKRGAVIVFCKNGQHF